MRIELIEKEITSDVIGAFFEVYNTLGYGFLEFVYSLAMERELLRRGHTVEREVSVPIMYKGELLTTQRVDMIVDRKVVVENKAGPLLPPTSRLQALSYVRSTTLEVGLVLHFGPGSQILSGCSYEHEKLDLIDSRDPLIRAIRVTGVHAFSR